VASALTSSLQSTPDSKGSRFKVKSKAGLELFIIFGWAKAHERLQSAYLVKIQNFFGKDKTTVRLGVSLNQIVTGTGAVLVPLQTGEG
jgi:hypothetical protein